MFEITLPLVPRLEDPRPESAFLGIGIMGLWTARHGEFEPTDDPPPAPPEGDNAEEA